MSHIISRRLLTVLCVLNTVLCLQAQPAPADADYAALEALNNESSPGSPKDIGWEKYLTWQDRHLQTYESAAMAFYVAHPADPRRWRAVTGLIVSPPSFIKGFGPDVATKGAAAIIRNETALANWHERAESLRQAMLASADAPSAARELVEWSQFMDDLRATAAAKARGAPFDFSGFRARFDAYIASYALPEPDRITYRASEYLAFLESNVPGSSVEIWRHLLDAPNATLRDKATEQVRYLDLVSKPLDMTFTAVDGRVVDLKALRGKVVLIDFWATWCHWCVEELPNVTANFRKYHDRGFEVVGITLEDAQLDPADTPEQSAAKLAKARKVLKDFTTKHEIPWPQYFDGLVRENKFSTQYAVQGIPAMFLLDQDGKVVSTNARGELLEKEVKRLLKL